MPEQDAETAVPGSLTDDDEWTDPEDLDEFALGVIDQWMPAPEHEGSPLQRMLRLMTSEIRRLRAQVAGHAERIAAQSELLSKRAEGTYADTAGKFTATTEWTKEPPTESGWYWFRWPDGGVNVFQINDAAQARWVNDESPGEWCGPLVPPGENR